MVSESEDYADFRILSARCPSGSKKNSMSTETTNGVPRHRFTLGEVLSWNIDLDVIVGNGWTRITLKEIPQFIVDSFDFITKNGLHIDGIFRKEGNSARLNRPEVLEVYRGVRPIPQDFSVFDVCTMVKRFLKDLKPTLLNSDDVRAKLLAKARKAKITGVFELSHLEIVDIFESTSRQMTPAHLGTLGYIMRLLSRIARHSESHKMSTDNLAVVLVGSVFGDFMTSGGTESRKKMQHIKKCSEAELHAKKEDMSVQVAAVKMLIVNANLIGLPHGHYVSSNRLHLNSHQNVRSTSAMPNMRCASVSTENEEGPQVFNMAKASMMHHQYPVARTTTLTRRDSDLTHVKGTNKQRENSTKRSSSFLPIPSLRGLRDRVSHHILKRNKSPSPDKLDRQLFKPFSAGVTHPGFFSSSVPTSSSNLPPPPPPPSRGRNPSSSSVLSRKLDTGDEDSTQKKGSTSSGRRSRAHVIKGNINSARDTDSQKSFQMSPIAAEKRTSVSSSSSTVTNRSLRRVSQSDKHNDVFLNGTLHRGDATPPKKKKSGSFVIRRNTSDSAKNPQRITRRPTFWGVDTITEEEKENNRKSQIMIEKAKIEESVLEDTVEEAEISVLELMNNQARLRRVGVAERRQRRLAAKSNPSESMMGLNGYEMTLSNEQHAEDGKKEASELEHELPTVFPKEKPIMVSFPPFKPKSRFGQQLEREMKQRLDIVATPMNNRRSESIPLRKLDSIRIQQNGQVWVGKTQTFVSSPIPKTPRTDTGKAEKVSPILARSPLFRSPSTAFSTDSSPKFFGFRSKSHLTETRVCSGQDYAALATPPRDRRVSRRPIPESNLIYSSSVPPIRKQTALVRSSSYFENHYPLVGFSDNPQAASSPISTVFPLVPDDSLFKCPQLPPMKTHESKQRRKKKESSSSTFRMSDDEKGFGDFNEVLKNSTEETKFVHTPVESRPSVTALQLGLVQSRINHFQTIEKSSFSSGGRPSSISLKSIDSTMSSGKNL